MSTLNEHINATRDPDLVDRLTAAAEIEGIASARTWVEMNIGKLVSAEVEGTTLSAVHAYAVANYNPPEPPPRPGQNPAAVTDPLIFAAIASVTAPEE